ncbi:hypothetical protein [Anaeromyxobacter oryzae]|uniref:Uncharacterized protein n=1 Tax=Anaeromyxobacter oryzae TaxID=2918170 RepID=A0ABN6MVD8_9BACT|nr:hypothetical protein [Anaeromyxobacter oryzae]BDG04947.1 hypothetical protein AMOR_39430 [Anaeromyxobacter oryzae]
MTTELEAALAELEATRKALEEERAAHAPRVDAPEPHPLRGRCAVCDSNHQPGQHSHCMHCRRPIGSRFYADPPVPPCPTCHAEGVPPPPPGPTAPLEIGRARNWSKS